MIQGLLIFQHGGGEKEDYTLVTGDCNGKDVSEKVSSRPRKLNQNVSSVGLLVLQLTPAEDARTAKEMLMQPCLSLSQSERTVLVIL